MNPFKARQQQPLNELETVNYFHRALHLGCYGSPRFAFGAINGTSKEKLYEEIGLELLKGRRWFRRLCNMKLYKLNYLLVIMRLFLFYKVAS